MNSSPHGSAVQDQAGDLALAILLGLRPRQVVAVANEPHLYTKKFFDFIRWMLGR
ncbi:hypothetical protein ACWEOE_21370 [Amycolatopsis sp. NPDC004368]